MKSRLVLYQKTKILDLSKLKAFADDKINVNWKLLSYYQKVENIVENKEQNAGNQHFLLFPQCFPKIPWGSLKPGFCCMNVEC